LHGQPEQDGNVTAEDTIAGDPPSLAVALKRFDEVWTTAPASDTDVQEQAREPAEDASDRPFDDVYHRYGHRIIEQAWHEMTERREHGEITARQVGFDETVMIPIGKRAITLTVDRIERPASPTETHADAPQQRQQGHRVPTRYVRDRLGAASDRPDLRALLYMLAAEQQSGAATPVEVSQRNMTTGEREPLMIRPRQRESLQDELLSAVEGILRNDFTPRPETHRCQSCPFLLICPAK
ncbi:MAG TPA: PD-(D/E)XK nuclease family protein, partial [Ktedonobacterales bacterium]